MARKKCEKCNKPPKKLRLRYNGGERRCAGMLNILIELLKSFDERKLWIVYQFAVNLK